MKLYFRQTGAEFSPCRRYRYTLWRKWTSGKLINFLMLNPSTADESKNDPTVERQEQRARKWGYAGIIVTNLFAFRSTDPKQLKTTLDPIGPENDAAILRAAKECDTVVCAWGGNGAYLDRANHVLRLLRSAGIKTYALRVSEKTGQPEHPLYIGYNERLRKFEFNKGGTYCL